MDVTPAWSTVDPPGYVGHLPDSSIIGPIKYQVTTKLPQNTKEIQVYAFISLHGMEPGFKRGYYAIYTESNDESQKFKCFMNIANVNDTVVNSDNFWLPYGEGIKPAVFMELISPEGLKPKKPQKKKAKGDMKEYAWQSDDETEHVYAQAFVTGYRTRS